MMTALVLLAQVLPARDSSVVIAAGTRIRAQLEQPASIRSMRAGEIILMSVGRELVVGSRVALPAGTRIVARIDSNSHESVRQSRLDVRMHLVEMIFADGDSIAFAQPLPGSSSDAEWLRAEKGAPIDLFLEASLVFDRAQLMEAEAFAAAHSEFRPGAGEKSCFVGGSPGTPDLTIAGSPPLLGSDGVPLNSGTPPTIIPGIPPTPDSWVPC